MKKLGITLAISSVIFSSTLLAELKEITVSKQYGLSYLALTVIEEKKLIEKYAKKQGLGEIKVNWATFGGGSVANDALLSGNAHLVSGGNSPFIRLWDKTKGKVKALAALNEIPLSFVSNNKEIKSIKDLTSKDKIAVPSVKVSIQSSILQMAAVKEYGLENYDKFDNLTVSLKHPDAYLAVTTGSTEVNGHIGAEPFTTLELENPNVHEVFNSYDILGGAHTTNLVWTSEDFYKNNPKLSKSVVDALNEANKFIKENQDEVIKLYLSSTKSKESPEIIAKVLNNKAVVYNTKPKENITKFSDFLYDIGAIKQKPKDWKELFFDAVK